MKRNQNFKTYVAEMIGTFMLVFGGLSAIAAVTLGAATTSDVVIPFGFGLALMIAVFSLGHISGAHFNPAVTIGLWTGGHFPRKKVIPYLLMQVVGALAATLVITTAFPSLENLGVTAPTHGMIPTLIFETIGTFILTFVIASIATDDRTKSIPNGLAIGGTLLMLALATGWVGGGSFNPARTLGPALIAGNFADIWIYFAAPIVGGIVAVQTYNAIKE